MEQEIESGDDEKLSNSADKDSTCTDPQALVVKTGIIEPAIENSDIPTSDQQSQIHTNHPPNPSHDSPTSLPDDITSCSKSPSDANQQPIPNECPHCGEKSRGSEALSNHLRTKHLTKPSFLCSNCCRVYLKQSLYLEHQKNCTKV